MLDVSDLYHQFERQYGRQPRLFQAPGRVNLIGEHTDYNEGFVLPTAINYSTVVAGAWREDRVVRVCSLDFNEEFEFDLNHSASPQQGLWLNYVEGVARSLELAGREIKGADLLIKSEVPIGGGLSSSAALEISVGFALLSLSEQKIDRITLAKAGQRAEHEYVGAKVGLMDQLTSAFGRRDSALLIDCRSFEITPIAMDTSSLAIVVCDTNIKHKLSASEYNTRRAECEQAVKILKAFLPHLRALRDVSGNDFQQYEEHLPEPIRRRCRHVVTENARTLAAANALRKNDIEVMGELMFESHRSLKDDYEVSCRELDLLVEFAANIDGVIGARMTGGGFGGCTVNFVRKEVAEQFSHTISRKYKNTTDIAPTIYDVEPSEGAGEITLSRN
jgi:galactokinase